MRIGGCNEESKAEKIKTEKVKAMGVGCGSRQGSKRLNKEMLMSMEDDGIQETRKRQVKPLEIGKTQPPLRTIGIEDGGIKK